MSNLVKARVLKPQYYDKFHCIGTDCEDNCCKGWRIFVDKKTYKEYQKVQDAEFRAKLDESVKRLRGEIANNNRYAQLVLDEEQICPFQNEERLCEIQLHLGEKYLSGTCQLYPRLKRVMQKDFLELSLSMSCPEVVRVALFNKNPMEFDLNEEEFERGSMMWRTGITAPAEGEVATPYLEYGWIMREAAIDIMQCRHYSIADRIIIIGMMLSQIVNLPEEVKAADIPQIVNLYKNGLETDELRALLDTAQPDINAQKRAVAVIYDAIFRRHLGGKQADSAFSQLVNTFMDRLRKLHPEQSKFDNVIPYIDEDIKQLTDKHWADFLGDWDYVLENYLVNFMFSELFPLKYHDKGLSPYHHCLILAEQYMLLKILLCGNFQEEEGFSQPYITHIITQISNMNQHSDSGLVIAQNYQKSGIDDLAYLYNLLA